MKKRFNIMHLVLNLNIGGLEWVVINLLKRLDKDRFSPSVACLLNGGTLVNEVKHLGVEVDILNKPDKLDFSVSLRLAKILKEKNINLIHTHNTAAYIYGGIAAKLAGTDAIVHTEHGRIFPDKKRLMLTERIFSLFTHKIIAVSHELKNSLIEFEGINPKKIEVIPNGIDLDIFRPLSQDIIQEKRRAIGLEKDDFIIGNIARLDEVKDHKNLIKTFHLAQKELTPSKLIIVGDGPLKEKLATFAKDIGVNGRVLFLGERNDIAELLNIFDVFVLSSKSEGISLTLLEAMATKKPVVATNVGGNCEIIEDGKDGYLVPPGHSQKLAQAILDVAQNPQMAKEIGNSAYEKVKEKFNLEKVVEDYQTIYESALLRN